MKTDEMVMKKDDQYGSQVEGLFQQG